MCPQPGRVTASTLLLLFPLVLASVAGATDQTDAAAKARSSYSQFIAPRTGDKEGLNRMTSPLVNGGSLTTLDGSQTFTVSGMKSSGKATLKVTIIPSPGTGDLSSVIIGQDLDGDGTLETLSTFPGMSGKMVSGVCTNGYIACTPGTYSGCVFNKWAADNTGKVGATAVPTVNDLSNCYCFNNYCSSFNNTMVLNLNSIVSDMGGGVVAAFLAQRSDYAISSASASEGSISYFGTKMEGAAANSAGAEACSKPATKTCPPGHTYKSASNRCELDTPYCESGYTYSAVFGKCESSPSYPATQTTLCPDGWTPAGEKCTQDSQYDATPHTGCTVKMDNMLLDPAPVPGVGRLYVVNGKWEMVTVDSTCQVTSPACTWNGDGTGVCDSLPTVFSSDTTYTCAAGDVVSGDKCLHTAYQSATPSLQCLDGSTPTLKYCITGTQVNPTCPSTDTQSGSVCYTDYTPVCDDPNYPTPMSGQPDYCRAANSSVCASAASDPTVPAPVIYSSQRPETIQTYYQDIAPLDGMGQSEITAQQAYPNSVYNLVRTMANNQPGEQMKTCEVTRNVNITLDSKTFRTNEITKNTNTDENICLTYDRVGETGVSVLLRTAHRGVDCLNTTVPPLEQSVNLGTVSFTPDGGADYANGYTLTKVDMLYKIIGSGCSNVQDSTSWTLGNGAFPFDIRTGCYAGGVQNFTLTTSVVFTYNAQDFTENVVNGCSTFETDPNCRLKDEKWDDRDSVFNFLPTGFKMSRVCEDFNGPIRNTQFCRDWWIKKRTYSCTNGAPGYTFDETRFKAIKNSVNLSGDTMSYSDDYTDLDGVHHTGASSYVIGAPPADTPCEKICKVKMVVPDSAVGPMGPASEERTEGANAGAGYIYNYKSCIEDASGNATCPVADGEELVSDCACDDTAAFGQALGALTAVSSLKNDSICSSVVNPPAPSSGP